MLCSSPFAFPTADVLALGLACHSFLLDWYLTGVSFAKQFSKVVVSIYTPTNVPHRSAAVWCFTSLLTLDTVSPSKFSSSTFPYWLFGDRYSVLWNTCSKLLSIFLLTCLSLSYTFIGILFIAISFPVLDYISYKYLLSLRGLTFHSSSHDV